MSFWFLNNQPPKSRVRIFDQFTEYYRNEDQVIEAQSILLNLHGFNRQGQSGREALKIGHAESNCTVNMGRLA